MTIDLRNWKKTGSKELCNTGVGIDSFELPNGFGIYVNKNVDQASRSKGFQKFWILGNEYTSLVVQWCS